MFEGSTAEASQPASQAQPPDSPLTSTEQEGPPTPTPAVREMKTVPTRPSLTPGELSKLQSVADHTPGHDSTPWPELKRLILIQVSYDIHMYMHGDLPTITSSTDHSHRNGLMFETFPLRGPPSPHSTTVRLPVDCKTNDEAKAELQKIEELLAEFDECVWAYRASILRLTLQ